MRCAVRSIGRPRRHRCSTPPSSSAPGTLGSALLAEALGTARFAGVQALVTGPLTSTLRGLVPVHASHLAAGKAPGADVALLVFERGRASNGRDDAFLLPAPADLLPLARQLRAADVRRLLVVLPHVPSMLPRALEQGFASHDEHAVAALGFEHIVFVRAAQDSVAAAGGSRVERFAAWWFSQLRWMVPQRQQALRAVVLARVVIVLARLLAAAPAGTRVAPAELLWRAAQPEADAQAVLAPWLGIAPTSR
jgi:hypothetical protein